MLAGLGVGLLLLAALLWALARWARGRSGVPAGRVVYSDTSRWAKPEKALFSAALGLTGKPDYLVRQGRAVIPVEVKSARAPAEGPRPAHVYQLAAYCALVAEAYGRRPAYGLIRYADRTLAVDYTPALEAELHALLADLRAALEAAEAIGLGLSEQHRSHQSPGRCRGCGYQTICDEALAAP